MTFNGDAFIVFVVQLVADKMPLQIKSRWYRMGK